MNELENTQKFISIHYPGVVVNTEKAIETLGGIHKISETIGDENRKLTLKFRPNDAFCKGVHGVRSPINALVMKIKVKKKSKKVVSYELLGHIQSEYQFKNLCDFQYLPVEGGVDILDKMVPTAVDINWFQSNCPLLFTPACYSRVDTPQNYFFLKDKPGEHGDSASVISSSRRKRFGNACFLSFEEKEVPLKPRNLSISTMFDKTALEEIQKLKKLFEERPIFTKKAAAGLSGIALKNLKTFLPQVGYHFNNGPWRAMWVRFGYDPRKDPTAKIYQLIDYRVKHFEEAFSKRSIRYGIIPRVPRGSKEEEPIPPDCHIFKPGSLPPFRQFFYQYCDIHLPEVQSILETVELRAECDYQDGWLPEGTVATCRRIIENYVVEEMTRRQNEASNDAETGPSPMDSEESSDSEIDMKNIALF